VTVSAGDQTVHGRLRRSFGFADGPVGQRRGHVELVALTDAGRVVIDAVLSQMAVLQTAVCAALPEQSRAQLLTLLAALHNGLPAVDVNAMAEVAPRRRRPTESRPR